MSGVYSEDPILATRAGRCNLENSLINDFDQCAITLVKEGGIALTGSQAKPTDSRSNYSSGGGFSI